MKKSLVLLCALLQNIISYSAVRTAQQAAQLAAEFTNNQPSLSKIRKTLCSASNLSLTHTFNKRSSTEPAVYVFNQNDGTGFVLVSADDLTVDILGYSDKGSFDFSTANQDFLWWIKRYIKEIENVESTDASQVGSASKKATATSTTAIYPLLGDIAWNQSAPYWNSCPFDLCYPTEQCYTGCVATAAAQLMRFWKYPSQGSGSHSYTWTSTSKSGKRTKSKKLSQDFSAITFDWGNMLETYGSSTSDYTTEQADAVATLMYACGVACDMQYGGSTVGGSGAWTDDMGKGLISYFGYKNTAKFITTYKQTDYEGKDFKDNSCAMENVGWDQSISSFTTAFNAELEAGRPILMGGEGSSGGHEFVCDGRDAQGNFHINWGWGGNCNCYVTLSALIPDGKTYNFSDEIDAVIGIEPDIIGKCAIPSVSVVNGKLVFECATEGADISYTITPSGAAMGTISHNSSEPVDLQATFTVSCYAFKNGYLSSDTVTKEIEVIPGDIDGDGKVSVSDVSMLINQLLNK